MSPLEIARFIIRGIHWGTPWNETVIETLTVVQDLEKGFGFRIVSRENPAFWVQMTKESAENIITLSGCQGGGIIYSTWKHNALPIFDVGLTLIPRI